MLKVVVADDANFNPLNYLLAPTCVVLFALKNATIIDDTLFLSCWHLVS